MIDIGSITGFMLIFFISASGWGRLAAKLIYKHSVNSIVYEVSLGMALWVLIGGPLSTFSLVSPLIIDSVLLLGLIFAAIIAYRCLQGKRTENRNYSLKEEIKAKFSLIVSREAIPILMVSAVTLFFVSTVIPATIFNMHDDFYKYFPRLMRLIQSGTLGGTPFDYVGSDSLGAHFFLQSFLVTHFPLKYINGFDVVFCFLVGGLLLNDIGRKSKLPWYYRAGVIVIYIMINPQYVNISAMYSGSLMILALIYASLLFCDHLERAELKETIFAAIPIALIGASLLGLKHTFVPFSVIYLGLFFLLLVGLAIKQKKMVVAAGISTATAGLMLALVPWLWAVSDDLIKFYFEVIEKTASKSMPQELSKADSSLVETLMSSQKLYYGGTALEYSLMVLCIFAAALWALSLLWKKEDTHKGEYLFVGVSAGFAATIAYMLNAYMAREIYVGIRYSCPIIIAVLPAMALLSGRSSGLAKKDDYEKGSLRELCGILLILISGLSLGAMMLDDWLERMSKIKDYEAMVSFPFTNDYRSYMNYSLSNVEKDIVQTMQDKTEENSIILTWFDTPFWLDFNRNRIFTVSGAGKINAEEQLKNSSNRGRWLQDYLKGFEVRYVIWGYSGPPKEGQGENKDNLARVLNSLKQESRIVYDDGSRVVFDIK